MTDIPPSSPGFGSASIAQRFNAVRDRIATAALAAGRDASSVVLTAVSKTQSPEAIDAALATGQRVFGENRVQEARGRWIERDTVRNRLELRLIGPLQSNKVAEAVGLFDVIETLDREKLARALAEVVQKAGHSPRLLVQVNTGAEPQKAGVLPDDADALIERARVDYGLPVEGLMAIPPAGANPDDHFSLLVHIAERNGLGVLSMGMSGDFEAAIRCGATHVRVGSALFGERMASPGVHKA